MNKLFNTNYSCFFKICFRTMHVPSKASLRECKDFGIEFSSDKNFILQYRWKKSQYALKSLDEVDISCIHYKSAVTILINEEKISDTSILEKELNQFKSKIIASNPDCEINFQQKKSLIIEEKIYAIDFEFEINHVQCINNTLRPYSLGIVCYTLKNLFVVFDELGLLFLMKITKNRNVNVGDIVFFNFKLDTDNQKLETTNIYLPFDHFIENAYMEKFISAHDYYIERYKSYGINCATINLATEYATSEKETLLIDYYRTLDIPLLESPDDMFDLYNKEKSYVSSLDIKSIFNSFKFECYTCGVSHHPDELDYRERVELSTDDVFLNKFIRSINDDWNISPRIPDLINEEHPKTWKDRERDKKVIKMAKEKYNQEEHIWFWVKKELKENYAVQKIRYDFLEHWPVDHYINIFKHIDISQLPEFLKSHNKGLLPYQFEPTYSMKIIEDNN